MANPKRPRDPNQRAKLVVDIATGESDEPKAPLDKNPEARRALAPPAHVSTSFIERSNLTMRMNMRRFTRLTNAFSKKIENHAATVALHFQFYNFARPHKSLKNPYPRTPAMAAGVDDHIWSLLEIAALLDS